jgi:zinc transport system substrate-binding protein
MKRRCIGPFLLKGVWVFVGFLLIFLGTCPYAQAQPKLKVVTTLFPLQEFSKAVGGEKVQADLLLPPGAEAHAWEPKVSDLGKVHKADVFIYIGRAMEPWAHDLLTALKGKQLKVVEASAGVPLLEAQDFDHPKEGGHSQKHSREGAVDPHVWMDFALDLKIIDAIAAAYIEKDPGNASQYRAQAKAYQSRLEDLDQKYQSSLARCRHRRIILGGHSAFAYLARRYGLQQVALYGVSPNAEPTPKKLTEVINAARNEGVKFIFFEELINPKMALVLAKEAGIQTLVLHGGANLTREQIEKKVTFLELMEKNLENLRKGLECEP